MKNIPLSLTPDAPSPRSLASSPPPSPCFQNFPSPGFEGAEKKLELDFYPGVDLRTLPRSDIDAICGAAKCTVVNKTSCPFFDGYLLSESSLFIYPSKILIKTCGTTSLLLCLPTLLDATKALGTEPEFVQYSRTQFMFPDRQPKIHRSFDSEVDYLNTFFPNGGGHIFGAINGCRWHLYTADISGDRSTTSGREQTLEIVMTQLDPSKMLQFFKVHDSAPPGFIFPATAEDSTRMSGIDRLLPGATVDAFLFDPCGYSCNGFLGDAFFTIHITPESHCSFVSFETNVKLADYDELVSRVLNTFCPGRFTASLFVDEGSLVRNSMKGLPTDIAGYATKTCAYQKFSGSYNVTCAQFVALRIDSPQQTAAEEAQLKSMAEELKSQSDAASVFSDAVDIIKYSTTKKLSALELSNLVLHALRVKFSVETTDLPVDQALQNILSTEHPKEPFYLVDVNEIIRRFRKWVEVYQRVEPFFQVKCNGHPGVLLTLSNLGCGFTCHTVQEVKSLLSLGVAPSRICFANPWKLDTHIRFCQQAGVTIMAFSDFTELRKIAKNCPEARAILNITGNYIPKQQGVVQHTTLPGATMDKVPALFEEALQLGVRILGCSFDIAPHCVEIGQYKRALKDAKSVFVTASKILGYQLRVLDIGAAFPEEDSSQANQEADCKTKSESSATFTTIADRVLHWVSKYFSPKVRVIARPSRFLTASSHVLAVSVVDRKPITGSDLMQLVETLSKSTEDMVLFEALLKTQSDRFKPASAAAFDGDALGFIYFINDGIFGSFNHLMFEAKRVLPEVLLRDKNRMFPCAILGPKGQEDCVVPQAQLPELQIGDWLFFRNMGAHALSSASYLHGVSLPAVKFICREKT